MVQALKGVHTHTHTYACTRVLTEIGDLTNLHILLNDSRPKIKAVF